MPCTHRGPARGATLPPPPRRAPPCSVLPRLGQVGLPCLAPPRLTAPRRLSGDEHVGTSRAGPVWECAAAGCRSIPWWRERLKTDHWLQQKLGGRVRSEHIEPLQLGDSGAPLGLARPRQQDVARQERSRRRGWAARPMITRRAGAWQEEAMAVGTLKLEANLRLGSFVWLDEWALS